MKIYLEAISFICILCIFMRFVEKWKYYLSFLVEFEDEDKDETKEIDKRATSIGHYKSTDNHNDLAQRIMMGDMLGTGIPGGTDFNTTTLL